MINFTFSSTTKIIFGKNVQCKAGEEIKSLGGTTVLVLFGGSSAKKSGLLSEVEKSLTASHLSYSLFGGVMPNPVLSYVHQAIAFAKEKKIDFILAVGGGSVIDAGKAIAMGLSNDGEVWDFYDRIRKAEKAIPIGAIVTLASSGSEASQISVITKDEGLIKKSCITEATRPKFAMMNPEITYSLPPYQTACGIVDIMMHTLDRYLSPSQYTSDLTDGISEALLKAAIKNGKIVMKDPTNYDARAELLWAGSLSQNDLTGLGRVTDFAPHQLEHELSGEYDVAHGAGLAAIWAPWARYVCSNDVSRFVKYAINVWSIAFDDSNPQNTAFAGIDATEAFFASLGMPISIGELLGRQISDEKIDELSEKCTYFGKRTIGTLRILDKKDIAAIYKLAR